jgi:hypothetical protein
VRVNGGETQGRGKRLGRMGALDEAATVWLTPGQVVQLLGKVGGTAPNPETLRNWVSAGRIEGAFTQGTARRRGDARIPFEEVQRLAAEQGRHLCEAALAELTRTASPPGAGHGTRTRYRRGCRCGPCAAANKQYLDDYRERRGQRSTPRRRKRDDTDQASRGHASERYAQGTTLDELLKEW